MPRKHFFIISVFAVFLILSSSCAYAILQPPSVMLNITVYVTEGNKDFHRSGCGLLYGRQISGIPLGQAYKEGYTPCGYCKPPQIQK